MSLHMYVCKGYFGKSSHNSQIIYNRYIIPYTRKLSRKKIYAIFKIWYAKLSHNHFHNKIFSTIAWIDQKSYVCTWSSKGMSVTYIMVLLQKWTTQANSAIVSDKFSLNRGQGPPLQYLIHCILVLIITIH